LDDQRAIERACNGGAVRGSARWTQVKKERIDWKGACRSASRRWMPSVHCGARGLGGKKTEQP
jgi:hypothetical protein